MRGEEAALLRSDGARSRRCRLLGICILWTHRRAARQSRLDRSPDPYAALQLPRRAPPPLGYFAETSHAATRADSSSRENLPRICQQFLDGIAGFDET